MKQIYLIILTIIALLVTQTIAFSQSGMRYSEFAKKLEMFYHTDLIADITDEMPKTDFTVWGWDVGDFSDDGHNDIAFCIRRAGLKEKTVDVYIFADIDGFLVKVGQFEYEFVELPLEVGIAFKYGILYITQKFKHQHWKMISYKFINGSLSMYDEFLTLRQGRLTHEVCHNYYTLQSTEKYLNSVSGKVDFFADYITIPSYSRGRLIYKGITSEALVNSIEYVPVGAYWWKGEEDLSYTVSSAYDDNFLYFTINVKDDYVARPYNSRLTRGEEVEIWIDPTEYNSKNDRFAASRDEDLTYNNNLKSHIYKFDIVLGDFVNIEPIISISSTGELNPVQKIAAMNMNVVADLTETGYYVMFRIPFSVLDRQIPVSEEMVEWGCTVRVIDIDNEFRSEEATILQTSTNFEDHNPSSYGSIVFVPDQLWYGETINIYREKIIQVLEEFGY